MVSKLDGNAEYSQVAKNRIQSSKLDIRIIAEKDETTFDVVNGKVPSVSCSNREKYYADGLKLALSDKQHLKGITSSLHGLTPKELSSIKLSIVLIMDMTCYVSCINIVDKNVYVFHDIYTLNYPKQSRKSMKALLMMLH